MFGRNEYQRELIETTTVTPRQPPVNDKASNFNQLLQPSRPNNGFQSYQPRQITETSTTTRQSYFGRQPSLFESTSPSSLCKIN